MDNDRIVVQKFVIPPGMWEGHHTHSGNQLWVQMTDGEWTSHADRTKVSRVKAGAVGWLPPADHPENDEGSINTGSTPIELVWVTLKPHTATASEIAAMKGYRLVYPEIPGELVLENDQLVVAARSWCSLARGKACTHTRATNFTSTSKAVSGRCEGQEKRTSRNR